jgi:hypothetical protein
VSVYSATNREKLSEVESKVESAYKLRLYTLDGKNLINSNTCVVILCGAVRIGNEMDRS